VPANLPGSSAPLINQRAGVVQFQVPSTKDSPVKGDGSLLTLHFKALAEAPAAAISLQFAAANESGTNVLVHLPTAFTVGIEK